MPEPAPAPTESESRAAAVQKLLALLPPDRRAEFAEALAHRDLHCGEMLTSLLNKEQAGRKRRRNLLILLAVALEGIAAFLLFPPSAPLIGAVCGVVGVALLIGAITVDAPTRLECAVLETAVQDNSKESIGVLLEEIHLSMLPTDLHQRMKKALTARLRSLTPEDAGLFTPIQRHKICRLFRHASLVSEPDLLFAALSALRHIGDHVCLGVIYSLATQEAYYRSTQQLRQAAQHCLDKLGDRLDFGSLEKLPLYIQILRHQFQAEAIIPQSYAQGMLALRRLLPQLTADNYEQILSPSDREQLYQLFAQALSSPLMREKQFEASRYGTAALLEEILRTAQRLRDTRALPPLRRFSHYRTLPRDLEAIRPKVKEAEVLLEALAKLEQESAVLLRGATAPAQPAEDLLRPVASAASTTDPAELLRAAPSQPIQQPLSLPTAQEPPSPPIQRRSRP